MRRPFRLSRNPLTVRNGRGKSVRGDHQGPSLAFQSELLEGIFNFLKKFERGEKFFRHAHRPPSERLGACLSIQRKTLSARMHRGSVKAPEKRQLFHRHRD